MNLENNFYYALKFSYNFHGSTTDHLSRFEVARCDLATSEPRLAASHGQQAVVTMATPRPTLQSVNAPWVPVTDGGIDATTTPPPGGDSENFQDEEVDSAHHASDINVLSSEVREGIYDTGV